MDFDMFDGLFLPGMEDFSFDEMAYDVIIAGPFSKEGEFTGEAAWQSLILSPLGYEIAFLHHTKDDEEFQNLRQKVTSRGFYLCEDIEHELEGCKVLSVSGLFEESTLLIEEMLPLFELASRNHVLVCVDPGKVTDARKNAEDLKKLAPYIDFFLPNEEEAAALSDQPILPMMAQTFRDWGMKTVIIKTGAGGCFVKSETAPFAMGAIPTETINLTGIGANFAAGLIHGLFQDWQLKTKCEYATGCAAVSSTYPDPVEGARERKEQVRKILNNPYI